MNPTTGIYYILHGDDELAISEELAGLRRRLGKNDPAMGELNTTVLDGRLVSMGELRHICDSIPFMEDRRLVIVHGLLARLAPERRAKDSDAPGEEEAGWKGEFVKELIQYLPKLPPTTRLVLVETRTLEESHPLLKFALSQGREKGAIVALHVAPRESELVSWIRQRVRSKAGAINAEAAELMAALVGRDLRLLDLEIDKLLLFAQGRPVTAADVRSLVSQAREMDIFDLVDHVGRRETDQALRILHGLLEDGREPLYILAMLARQVRILIQVAELCAEGRTRDEIAKQADLHPFVVKKTLAQVHNFSMAQLEAAYQRIVAADWAIKTGDIDPVLALDMLVVAFGQ